MGPQRFWFFFPLAITAILVWLGRDVHTPRSIPASFDLLTLTAQEIAQLLNNKTFTSLELTKEYLRRIELDNRSGLRLLTMLELTPPAISLRIASERDLERSAGMTRGPLHGIPLIVKARMLPIWRRTLADAAEKGQHGDRSLPRYEDHFRRVRPTKRHCQPRCLHREEGERSRDVVIGKANLGVCIWGSSTHEIVG